MLRTTDNHEMSGQNKIDAANYRPVSLTCLCCKMLEHIIVSNVMKHVDDYNILTDCQHGFRARSCDTQFVITMIRTIIMSLFKEEHTVSI